ncbi:Complement control module protein [Phytophthora cinnamomi]|uniref:Complement control module protein n=1 Tax=Phytophthora cinnamomi TaxID=4785 RepID=UPI00355AA0E8|nr:Complement control module protein [Phytophthora cinnamomi]
MTLKCWNAAPPRKVPAIDTSAGVESLLAGNQAGRPRAAPKSARCRSQSSNWDKDAADAAGDSEDDHFDVTAATIPAPSHQIHAMPALWVSGRRRHSRSRSRRRTVSENYNHGLGGVSSNGASAGYSNNSTPTGSSSSSLSATLPSPLSSGDEQLRQAAAAAAAGGNLNQRLRITTPDGPRFAGWVRGQAAEVQWEALDPSVQCVRIDVCNVAWTVPTTIAHRVANDGTFRWRRVYWGMPIAEGYYVNIYDVTEQKDPADLLLLAQSERFAVIK